MKDEDIDRAIKEAEAHAEEDKKRKDLVEAKNQADNLVYSVEKALKDNGDKISDEDKKKLTDAVDEAKKKFESEDLDTVRQGIEELGKVSDEVFSKMYQNAQQGNNNENNNGPDPEVVVDDNN